MANKQLTSLSGGFVSTIGANDVGTAQAITLTGNLNAAGAGITGGLTVGGDLTVQGNIISSGTINAIVADNFLDLNVGYTGSNIQSTGTSAVAGIKQASAANTSITSFTSSSAGTTAFSTEITVSGVPANGESITLTNANTAYFVSFVNNGNTSINFAYNGNNSRFEAEIDTATIDTTTDAVADAINTLFNNLPQYSGSVLASVSTITASNNSVQLDLAFTDNTGGDVSSGNTTAGDGQAAYFTTSGGQVFAADDVIAISNADNTDNDGLFVVSSVSANGGGQDVFIKGTNSVEINQNTPFAQSEFPSAGADTNAIAIQAIVYALAMSNGTAFNDAGGNPITVGQPIYAYGATANEGDFSADGAYSVCGAGNVGLQDAYSVTPTISTTGNAIAFTTNNGGFTVSGSSASSIASTAGSLTLTGGAASTWHTSAGDLTIGGNSQAGALILESAEAQSDAVQITASNAAGGVAVSSGASGTVEISAGTSGAKVTTTATSQAQNVGTQFQIGALDLSATAGGFSLLGNKDSAVTMIGDTGAEAVLTISASAGPTPNSVGTVAIKGDHVSISNRFTALSTVGPSDLVSLAYNATGSAASGSFFVDSAGNVGNLVGKTISINSTSITANLGGAQTITFVNGGGTDTTFSAGAANIDVSVDTSDSDIAAAMATLFDSLADYSALSQGNAAIVTSDNAGDSNDDINFGGTVASNNPPYGFFQTNPAGGPNLYAVLANSTASNSAYQFAGCNRSTQDGILSGGLGEIETHGVATITVTGAVAASDVGKPIYLSSTAGAGTLTAPSTSGQVIFQVGILLTAKGTGTEDVLLQPQFMAEIA